MKGDNLKKMLRPEPELKPEYDFSAGVRGQYAKRYHAGSNVVVLDPDVARAFPSERKVNRSLRALAGRQGK